jgi:hypothetical protein
MDGERFGSSKASRCQRATAKTYIGGFSARFLCGVMTVAPQP